MANDILSLLFGRKKKRGTKSKSKKGKGKVRRVKVGYCIKKNRVVKVYVEKQGKRTIKKKHTGVGKKSKPCTTTVYKSKSKAEAKLRSKFGRRTKRKSITGIRRRRNSYGVGGGYMPTSSFASPYPSSVDAGQPWI
jgi:hypothetical protein